MHFNNLMVIVLILYVFQVPLYVSYDAILEPRHLRILLLFDIMFMLSRFLDLLIGFRTKEGDWEPNISKVIMKNLSTDFFLEICWTFGPFCLDIDHLNSIYYFLFKFPRFNNLMNISNVINRTLEFYCKSWTDSEKKRKVNQFIFM